MSDRPTVSQDQVSQLINDLSFERAENARLREFIREIGATPASYEEGAQGSSAQEQALMNAWIQRSRAAVDLSP